MRAADLNSVVTMPRMFLVFIGVFCFFISDLYPVLSVPMFVLFSAFFWMRSTFTYVNESFTRFYDGILFGLIFFVSSIFFGGAAFIANSVLGFSLLNSIIVGLSLPVLMVIFYFYAKYKVPASSSYKVKNNRIYPMQNSPGISPLAIGATVALSSMLVPLSQGSNMYAVFLILFLAVSSLVVIFCMRNTIADLQQIKSEERRHGVRYAFGNLEEIQEWRSRAWAPRLFRYLYMRVLSALR